MTARKRRILVCGMIAGDPLQGGAAWAVLQYVLGLQELGHEVWLVEPIRTSSLQPKGTTLQESYNARFFQHVAARFGLQGSAALLLTDSQQTVGLPYATLLEWAEHTDLLINVSGLLTDQRLFGRIPIRTYLDLDPAFNQLWHVQGVDVRFAGHTHFVTVGQAIGDADCPVPTCDLDWLKTLPPVVLSHWPVAAPPLHAALTTIGNWRGYGSITHEGVFYGQKAHSFRTLIDLPRRSQATCQVALSIHAGEVRDLQALGESGWVLADPLEVAATPDDYQRFVQGSWAEIGIAKAGYVQSRCGWFSDRSVCYLASGRPVVAQDTGFSRHLPTGSGLFAFATTEEAAWAVAQLQADYSRHSQAARAIAQEFFDSRRVLGKLLDLVGAAS